nr:MAG TPA: hypothetical protein [Caudoviricetes sp.]
MLLYPIGEIFIRGIRKALLHEKLAIWKSAV